MNYKNYIIPNIENKNIIITGANSGIGYHAAKIFTSHGANVIFACRNKQRALNAINKIQKNNPAAKCDYINLDLQSFKSVNSFIGAIKLKYPTIDILINNAGVIMQKNNHQSVDGFDSHTSTNCLSHFLLTISLLDNLKSSNNARIVTVSSFIEKVGCFNLDKFAKKDINSWQSYSQSKIANIILSYELNRRLKAAGITNIIPVACHPGVTATNSTQLKFLGKVLKRFSMPVEHGAMSLIIAATCPKLKGGEYLGFDGSLNISGNPCLNESSKITHDKHTANKLWQKCASLTQVIFN